MSRNVRRARPVVDYLRDTVEIQNQIALGVAGDRGRRHASFLEINWLLGNGGQPRSVV